MPNLNVGFLCAIIMTTASAYATGYTCLTSKRYTSCNTGYYMTGGTGAGNACTACPAGCTCSDNTTPTCCSTSKSCASLGTGWTGTYNECTGTQGSACSKPCSVTCSGNNTAQCPANANCTYNTTYQYTATQYYGGNCNASGTCPMSTFTCNSGFHPDGNTCVSNTKPCSGNLTDATGGNIVWNGSKWDYSGCTKSCDGNGIAHGLAYFDGDAWGTCRPESTTYGCHWGYYNDNGQSCKTCPAGSWCWNYTQPCPAGYFCPVGIYDPTYDGYNDKYKCPPGYTSDAGAKGSDKCYKSCTRSCTPQTCPANATCTHQETSPTSGIEYNGGTCDAPASACPMTFTCNPGYYGSSANNDTSCADCGPGNYCTGGTHRATCESTIPDNAPEPRKISTLYNGNWDDRDKHGTKISDYICDWYFDDETRTEYLQQARCSAGPEGYKYTHYYWCRPGYYASGPLTWGNWYTECLACTNKPDHAHFTNYGTPSAASAVEDNCPWACDAGYGKTSNNTCAQMCMSGITYLKSNGISVPLYATPQTSPANNVQLPGQSICYGSLATGGGADAINIQFNGTIYHSIQ